MDEYKVAIIYGEDNKNKHINDGQIEYIGSKGENTYHSFYMYEFLSKNYGELPMIKKLSPRYTPETLSYFITRLGSVVFLNTTKNIERYGKTGFLVLPDIITPKQKEALYLFADTIQDYQISIVYDLKLVDGIVDANQITPADDKTPREVIDYYFSSYDNKNNLTK